MSTIKASELKGRAVVSLAEAERVGTVTSLIFDPSANKVVGLKVKTGLFGGAQTLRADDIRNIGPDAVTINDRNLLHEHESEVPELKDMPTLEDLLSMKVVGDNGVLHGMLGDVELDPDNMSITQYEMSGSLWEHMRRAERGFKAASGIRYGKDLLIVPEVVGQDLSGRTGAAAASAGATAGATADTSDESFLPPPDNMPTLPDAARVSPASAESTAPTAPASDLPASDMPTSGLPAYTDAPSAEAAPVTAPIEQTAPSAMMSTGEGLPPADTAPMVGEPLREEPTRVDNPAPSTAEGTTRNETDS